MKAVDDPFIAFAQPEAGERDDDFAALAQRPLTAVATQRPDSTSAAVAPAVGTLLGFDLLDQPVVGGIAACPGEKFSARSTVALRHAMIGRNVVLLFEGGDPRAPIIMGVVEPRPLAAEMARAAVPTSVNVDGERQVIEAEREVVLRCGDASITLTRAGKVIIRGHYILSRSTGYNKIKGAAIDIN